MVYGISRDVTCQCSPGTSSLCSCSLDWSFQPLPWCLGASLVFLINVHFLPSVALLIYNVCQIVMKFLNCIASTELIYMHFIQSVTSRLLWRLETAHDVLTTKMADRAYVSWTTSSALLLLILCVMLIRR